MSIDPTFWCNPIKYDVARDSSIHYDKHKPSGPHNLEAANQDKSKKNKPYHAHGDGQLQVNKGKKPSTSK